MRRASLHHQASGGREPSAETCVSTRSQSSPHSGAWLTSAASIADIQIEEVTVNNEQRSERQKSRLSSVVSKTAKRVTLNRERSMYNFSQRANHKHTDDVKHNRFELRPMIFILQALLQSSRMLAVLVSDRFGAGAVGDAANVQTVGFVLGIHSVVLLGQRQGAHALPSPRLVRIPFIPARPRAPGPFLLSPLLFLRAAAGSCSDSQSFLNARHMSRHVYRRVCMDMLVQRLMINLGYASCVYTCV